MPIRNKRDKRDIRIVRPIRGLGDGNKNVLPVKGKELIDDLYARVGMIAGTNSGKTTTLNWIVRNCSDSRTTLVVICSTIHIDKVWQAIFKYCDRKKIPVLKFESLVDDSGMNNLDMLLKTLEEEQVDEEEKEEKKENVTPVKSGLEYVPLMITNPVEKEEPDKKKERKKVYKDIVPRYMVVLDDLSKAELSSNSVYDALKRCRKHQIRMFVISQSTIDIRPSSRAQISLLYFWPKAFDRDYIEKVYKMLRTAMTFDEFYALCDLVAQKKYSFLNLDRVNGTVRIDFGKPLKI